MQDETAENDEGSTSNVSSHEDRLKAAIHYAVGRICDDEADNLDVEITPHFIAALTEVVYKQIETMAIDVEFFAKHNKRTTISSDDVKLCARRNEDLYNKLSEFVGERTKQKEGSKKRKKTS
ncbi:putative apoptosis-inducing TAF9-like domain 1 family protein [Paraphysoderma sedebokerense]|nr:putative apoptosis-inducing TAF9-like domain 1 family protein [Paraphysoderma sedebokerense]